MASYSLGVEIEMRAAPHTVRHPLSEKHALYYEKLAAALRNRGLKAKADNLQGIRRDPENYDAWWITKDGSLGAPDQLIPMEAVSRILTTSGNWAQEIDTFWAAMKAVFHMPEKSTLCGSHIHVSRGRTNTFTLPQLKTIAYGIYLYEGLVLKLLMACREGNDYCTPNGQASSQLRNCGNLYEAAQLISSAPDAESLRDIMQDDRYVLWNFSNVAPGKSGTIEFRGGRFLRGKVRTKRWIAFAVAFIHAMICMDDLRTPGHTSLVNWSPASLYAVIKDAAGRLGMREHLPDDYRVLNESRRS